MRNCDDLLMFVETIGMTEFSLYFGILFTFHILLHLRRTGYVDFVLFYAGNCQRTFFIRNWSDFFLSFFELLVIFFVYTFIFLHSM